MSAGAFLRDERYRPKDRKHHPGAAVRILAESLAFYIGTLGFKLDWGGEEGGVIASVSRDGSCIMLSERFAVDAPAMVWIGIEDADLFDEWRASGVEIRQKPKNWTWAYEMKFGDPDGNVLWLGTDSRTDRPFEDALAD